MNVSTLRQAAFYLVWPLTFARPRESARHLIHPVYVGQLETTLRDGRRHRARSILGLRGPCRIRKALHTSTIFLRKCPNVFSHGACARARARTRVIDMLLMTRRVASIPIAEFLLESVRRDASGRRGTSDLGNSGFVFGRSDFFSGFLLSYFYRAFGHSARRSYV